MPFNIVRNDITKMKVDAIVNAANTSLQMGGGVCGAIFTAAGAEQLQSACDNLAPIKTGEAVITQGFKMPAKYIIHTAGPVYRDGKHGEDALLRDAYINSLKRAVENGCESIAFPLISSGIYGYPKAQALKVATSAIQDFLAGHDMNVSLVVFDNATFAVSEELLGNVKAYIDEHYVDEREIKYRRSQLLDVEEKAMQLEEISFESVKAMMPAPIMASDVGIEDWVGNLDEPFSTALLRIIDAKGKSDVEVYKRANLDRKLFSKIRRPDYRPSKKTAVALSVALELSLDETGDLLNRAGFALSRSQKFDVIVEYFITQGQYDIFEINNVLFNYDQPLLGG